MKGKEVDLKIFPVPHWYPKDGGRYIGTAHFIVTKDPESGWINLGTYRSQLLGKDTIGTQFIKGKHADIMLKKYQALKKPMPCASVIGCDPLLFIMGAARVSAFVSEYDLAGAIRGEAVETVMCETVDLPVPAHAEIVIEGLWDAEKFMDEGPFGEYTGYYSGVGTTSGAVFVAADSARPHLAPCAACAELNPRGAGADGQRGEAGVGDQASVGTRFGHTRVKIFQWRLSGAIVTRDTRPSQVPEGRPSTCGPRSSLATRRWTTSGWKNEEETAEPALAMVRRDSLCQLRRALRFDVGGREAQW